MPKLGYKTIRTGAGSRQQDEFMSEVQGEMAAGPEERDVTELVLQDILTGMLPAGTLAQADRP